MRVRLKSPILFLSLAILLLNGSVAFGQIRVAVEDGSANGTGSEIVDQLNANTNYNFTATLVFSSDIDTVAKLNDYDVVIVGHSGIGPSDQDWTAQMWSALRDWVDDGGGLVATAWIMYAVSSSTPGANDINYLIPGDVLQSYTWVAGSTMLDFSVAPSSHPITDGLNNFSPNSNHIEINTHPLPTGDTLLATAGGANNKAIIAREDIGPGEGRSVYLGVQYMAASSYNVSVLRSGDPDELLARSVTWAASGTGAPPPDVGSVSPDPVNWLDTLTITGDDLANASVTIGGVTATVTSNTSTQIEATVSDATPTGVQTVEVTTPGGVDDTQSVEVLGVPPSIASVSPDPVEWLATLTIDGNFLANATVTIGGVEASVVSNTTTQIEVIVADATPLGQQTVEVETTVASDTASVTVNGIPPILASASPDPVEWLGTLVINGDALASTTEVSIGGVLATIESAESNEVSVIVSSATPLGVQPIEVTTLGGSQSGLSVTVDAIAPIVEGVAPNPVPISDALTITGEALANAILVRIGGVNAEIQSNTAHEIVVRLGVATPLEPEQLVEVYTDFGLDENHTVEVVSAGFISTGRGCASLPHHPPSPAMSLVTLLALLLGLAILGRRQRKFAPATTR